MLKNLKFFVVFIFSSTLVFAQGFEYNGYSKNGDVKVIEEQIKKLNSALETEIINPILFGVEIKNIKNNFGELRGQGRSHEGLDIIAPLGTPIISPVDAVITQTGDEISAGIYIAAVSAGGETFVYMHLSEIAKNISPGIFVKKGSIIGFVGDTGNAKGAGSHLHFEIRKGDVINPFTRIKFDQTNESRNNSISLYIENGGNINDIQSILNKYNFKFETNIKNEIVKTSTSTKKIVLNKTLKEGDSGDEVKNLQKLLIQKNAGTISQSLKNISSDKFGPLTKKAVIELQKKYKINPSTGVVGQKTLKILNQ